MAKKKIDTIVTAYDKYGERHIKHIRANNTTEFIKKKEAFEKSLLHAPVVGTVMDEWWEEHQADINLNTQNGYIAPMKQIREQFGSTYIDDLHPLDVSRFLHSLYDEYKYKKQTLSLRLIVLNQVCDFAILKGYIDNNPCSAVKVPNKAVSGKRDISSPEDIEKIKTLAKRGQNDGALLLYMFLLYTGCRRGEILALNYEDIDRKNDLIHINKTVVFDHNDAVIQNHPKTEAGNRSVPLLPPLKGFIPKKLKGPVFESNGKLWTKSIVNKSVAKFQRENGIACTPHQLRHAYATVLYEIGIQVKDAQALLGHSSPEVTQGIYQHITEQHQKEVFKHLIENVK